MVDFKAGGWRLTADGKMYKQGQFVYVLEYLLEYRDANSNAAFCYVQVRQRRPVRWRVA